jgi:L-aspartate oxidase
VPLDLAGEGPGPTTSSVDVHDVLRSVKSLVWREAGVQRSGNGLTAAMDELCAWTPHVLDRTLAGPRGLESQNLCTLAGLLFESALLRCETRGVHWRSDHPERRDDTLLGHFVQQRGAGTEFRPLARGADGSAP